ncbi:MAG: hypothetical protein Kow0032_07350 [Methyloligellaceae bacterium]
MNAFSGAADVLFRDPNLAADAIYRAGGQGAGQNVRVIMRNPDRVAEFGGGRFVADTYSLSVRTSDVPQLEEGDTFEIESAVYAVQCEPLRDARRLMWKAEVRAQ